MSENEPVVSEICYEKGEKVMRHVRLSKLNVARIEFLWEKMKNFDILFNDFIGKDFESFLQHFIVQVEGEPQSAGLIWDVDDVGVFTLNNIVEGHSAQFHYVFWDMRFRGRENLCRSMLKYVMDKYQFHKLWTEIPVVATSSLQAADRVGLIREGRKRQEIPYKGVWADVNLYGVLRTDLDLPLPTGGNPPVKAVCYDCGQKYDKHHTPRPRSVV